MSKVQGFLKPYSMSIALLGALLLFPSEGFVAQVTEEKKTIDDVLKEATEIVIVKNLNKSEPFYSVTFPKETHFKQEKETQYKEDVSLFKVVEVIKSNSLKPGQQVKVWVRPAYGEAEMMFEHEYGSPKSLDHPMYTPTKSPGDEQMIIFLQSYVGRAKNAADVWENVYYAREGVSYKKKLLDLLRPKKTDFVFEVNFPFERREPNLSAPTITATFNGKVIFNRAAWTHPVTEMPAHVSGLKSASETISLHVKTETGIETDFKVDLKKGTYIFIHFDPKKKEFSLKQQIESPGYD